MKVHAHRLVGPPSADLSTETYHQHNPQVFDIFRVHDGRIVEHWDNMEPVPPRSEWANSGKF